MSILRRLSWPWLAAWLLLALAGSLALAAAGRSREREDFDNAARIAHRLLSQRAAQHDAVLATLALLQPAADADGLQRLPALYPQILAVRRLPAGQDWDDAGWRAAQDASRRQQRPVQAATDLAVGRQWLLLAAQPASFALQVDLRAAVPWAEWPMPRDGPVRVALELNGQDLALQPGQPAPSLLGRFEVRKPLASASQPFTLVVLRDLAWSALPWPALAGWWLLSGALVALAAAWQRQRSARKRAEALLRLGQVARLNTLGEMAAGLAHELNQPLTAVLANSQAARRLLDEEPPDIDPARTALQQAAAQARRAADVVARLRRSIEQPSGAALQPVLLQDTVRKAFQLLEPECARRGVVPRLDGAEPVRVQAEPVALEQIVHNLLTNALQALEQVPEAERELVVELRQSAGRGLLAVADSGPGIAPELLPRIFEPFVTTRAGGLGLGLPLCESLAGSMGGTLHASARAPRGARLELSLPEAA